MIDYTEALARMCSVKKVFLKISASSQENACVGLPFLIKLSESYNFIEQKTKHRSFALNLARL